MVSKNLSVQKIYPMSNREETALYFVGVIENFAPKCKQISSVEDFHLKPIMTFLLL